MKANAYPEPALRRKSATGPRNLLEFGQSRGITAIIDNRSNGEDGDQPGSAVEKSAADDAGLGYSFVPLADPQITEADVRALQEAVAAAPGPVFAKLWKRHALADAPRHRLSAGRADEGEDARRISSAETNGALRDDDKRSGPWFLTR